MDNPYHLIVPNFSTKRRKITCIIFQEIETKRTGSKWILSFIFMKTKSERMKNIWKPLLNDHNLTKHKSYINKHKFGYFHKIISYWVDIWGNGFFSLYGINFIVSLKFHNFPLIDNFEWKEKEFMNRPIFPRPTIRKLLKPSKWP